MSEPNVETNVRTAVQMFFKIGVVSVSLFLIKLHAYEPATLLKRNSNAVFSNEYCEIFQVAPLVAVSAE